MFQVEKLDNFPPFINFIGQYVEKINKKNENFIKFHNSRKMYKNLFKETLKNDKIMVPRYIK